MSEAISNLEVRRWKFDLPEADKCLLAFGELGVNFFHPLNPEPLNL